MPQLGSNQLPLGGVIQHRHLPLFFHKYNTETERYGVPPKIRFCFPSDPFGTIDTVEDRIKSTSSSNDNNDHSSTIPFSNSTSNPSGISSSSSSGAYKVGHNIIVECLEKRNINDIENENILDEKNGNDHVLVKKEKREAELRAFKTVELLLLGMYFIIKESFARTNSEKLSDNYGSTYSNRTNYYLNENESSNSIFSDIIRQAKIEHDQKNSTVIDLKMADLFFLLRSSERYLNNSNFLYSDYIDIQFIKYLF